MSSTLPSQSPSPSMRILGIDPGLRHCGWGVIDSRDNSLRFVAAGVIDPPTADDLAVRLRYLYESLQQFIRDFHPDEAAVEEVFMNRNPGTTLKLGQARGVVLLAPSMAGLAVTEYSTRSIKQSLVGKGNADKDQVAMMVHHLLPKLDEKSRDATDALAVAVCHAHHQATLRRWGNQSSNRLYYPKPKPNPYHIA